MSTKINLQALFISIKTEEKLAKHKKICTDKRLIQQCVFLTEKDRILKFRNHKKK